VEIARATGRSVIGVDLSPGMLEVARAKADAAGVGELVELRLGDLRELGRGPLALDAPAALVISPFRSLLHLRGWEEKAAAFRAVAATLAPGSRFAWNAFVFDPHIAASNDGYAARHGQLWEYVEHAPADNRIDLTVYAGAPGVEPRTVQLWWATRSEWEGLVAAAGLEVEALYGWFDRRPYDDRSSELVFVARKPA
jgi:SAM-dependent methyltransferase